MQLLKYVRYPHRYSTHDCDFITAADWSLIIWRPILYYLSVVVKKALTVQDKYICATKFELHMQNEAAEKQNNLTEENWNSVLCLIKFRPPPVSLITWRKLMVCQSKRRGLKEEQNKTNIRSILITSHSTQQWYDIIRLLTGLLVVGYESIL